MTDRELLELAAKAAGISEVIWPLNKSGQQVPWADGKPWNPLADDGDALRLAVKLRLAVHVTDLDEEGYSRAIASEWKLRVHVRETFTDDPCAATRRAIVRAAAAIAKGTT
jgi:hypothetical protein